MPSPMRCSRRLLAWLIKPTKYTQVCRSAKCFRFVTQIRVPGWLCAQHLLVVLSAAALLGTAHAHAVQQQEQESKRSHCVKKRPIPHSSGNVSSPSPNVPVAQMNRRHELLWAAACRASCGCHMTDHTPTAAILPHLTPNIPAPAPFLLQLTASASLQHQTSPW